jgi:hypothetical protein
MKKCNGSDRGKMDQRTIKRAGAGKERVVRGGREGKGQRKEEKRESRTRRRRGKRTGVGREQERSIENRGRPHLIGKVAASLEHSR